MHLLKSLIFLLIPRPWLVESVLLFAGKTQREGHRIINHFARQCRPLCWDYIIRSAAQRLMRWHIQVLTWVLEVFVYICQIQSRYLHLLHASCQYDFVRNNEWRGFVWQEQWRAHMRENSSLTFLTHRREETTDNSGWRLKDFTVWLRWIHYFILIVQRITFKEKVLGIIRVFVRRADWCTAARQGSWPASRWPQAKVPSATKKASTASAFDLRCPDTWRFPNHWNQWRGCRCGNISWILRKAGEVPSKMG